MDEKQTVINFDITEERLFAEMEAPIYESAEGQHFQVYPLIEGAMVLIYGTNREELSSYLNKLVESGYVLYSDNCFDGDSNYFAQYRKGEHALHVSYSHAETATRLIFGPIPQVDPLHLEPLGEKVTDPMITLLSLRAGGLSIVIRLEDGGFIVVDGGVTTERDLAELYYYLKANNLRGGKPVIHSWWITHCHGDHLQLPMEFIKRYHKEFELRSAVHNFPDLTRIDMSYDSSEAHWNTYIHAYVDILNTYYPDAKQYVCHTGEEMSFPGVKVRTICTHEEHYPAPLAHCNQSSSAWKLTFDNGKTAIVYGDIWPELGRYIARNFSAEYLKCDVMQVIHHGLAGAVLELYEKNDPEICLWATGQKRFEGKFTTAEQPDYTKVHQWCTGYKGEKLIAPYNAWLRDDSIKKRQHYSFRDDGVHNEIPIV